MQYLVIIPEVNQLSGFVYRLINNLSSGFY